MSGVSSCSPSDTQLNLSLTPSTLANALGEKTKDMQSQSHNFYKMCLMSSDCK